MSASAFPVQFSLHLALGSLFIIVYAWNRFGTPSSYRAATTAAQYRTAALLYTLMALSLYVGLSLSPELSLLALQLSPDAGLSEKATKLARELGEYSMPLLAVIVVTLVLPTFPPTARIDDKIRAAFRRMAQIPFEVRRLSSKLQEAPYVLSQHTHELMWSRFESDEDGPLTLFEEDRPLRQRWEKVTGVIVVLKRWSNDERYDLFFDEYRDEFQQLSELHEARSALAASYFKKISDLKKLNDSLHEELTASGSSQPQIEITMQSYQRMLKSFRKDYRAAFDDGVSDLLRKVCDFASRAILQCNATTRGRLRSIEDLGFRPEPCRATIHDIIKAFLLLILSCATVYVIAFKGGHHNPINPWLMIVLPPLLHGLAVVWAVLTSDTWDIAQRSDDGWRPWGHYLLIGILAVLTASIVKFILYGLYFRDVAATVDRLYIEAGLLLLPFTTGFLTAYNLDNEERPQLWVREMAGQAVLTAAAGVFAFNYLMPPPADSDPLSGLLHVLGTPWPLVVVPFLVGAVIGATVPCTYRHRKRNGLGWGPVFSESNGASEAAPVRPHEVPDYPVPSSASLPASS